MTISDDSARINDSFNANSKIQVSIVYRSGEIPARASKNIIPNPPQWTAADFVQQIEGAEADSKDMLPVAIAALFGRKKSAGGSFRHNANITALTGIFFDYDGELIDGAKVSLESIENKLKASGNGGIIYATSSYAEKGSWRLFLPFKKPLAISKAVKIYYCEKILAKLGLSTLQDENFKNLSMCFAFGRVEGTPELPAPVVVAGDWISDPIETDIENAELLDMPLENYLEIEEPKPAKTAPLFTSENRLSDEQIEDALSYVSSDTTREEWFTILAALYHDARDISIARRWSQESDRYEEAGFIRTWNSLGNSGSSKATSIATLLHKAQLNGWVHPFSALAKIEEVETPLDDKAFEEMFGSAANDDSPAKTKAAKTVIKKASSATWRRGLDLNDKGKPIASAANVALVLASDPNLKGAFGFNEFELVPMQKKETAVLPLPDNKPRVLGNLAELKVYVTRSEMRGGAGISRVSDSDLKNQVMSIAEQKENRFHPVRDHLLSLKWDGVQRVDRLFVDYLHCDDNVYTREAARLFLLAAVARVLNPDGQQFDNVPIIGGEQNARKTSFVRTLSYGLTGSLHKDLSDVQKTCESMRGKWIVEVAELKSFRHSDIEAMKDFFSAITDTYRRPYRPDEETFTRQCVFIGTTNAADYLKDPTGNRRFWPLDVAKGHLIDTEKLRNELDLIWSEAVVLYEQMKEQAGDKPLYLNLSPEAAAIAKQVQQSKRQESEADILATRIEDFIQPDDIGDPIKAINEMSVNRQIYEAYGQPEYRRLRVIKEAIEILIHKGVLGKKKRMRMGKSLGWFYPVLS